RMSASLPRRGCASSRAWAAQFPASCRRRWPRPCRPNGGAKPNDDRHPPTAPGVFEMKLLNSLALAACLVLPLAACKKEEAAPVERAPVAVPTTDDKAAWQEYLNDQVPRHMEGITAQPYVYRVPANDNPSDPEEYNRLLDKARMDVARGIVKGNILTYAGLDPTKTADLVVSAFETVTPNTM